MAVVTNLEQVHRDITERLCALYGERLERIILYGSYARGDFHDESDVDYLAVLSDAEVSTLTESGRIAPITNAYYLAHGLTISVFAVSDWHFNTMSKPLFEQVRKQGITIYDRTPEPTYS